MTIEELTQKVKDNIGKRSEAERKQMLLGVEILDENGDFHPRWFSKKETIEDKEKLPNKNNTN